MSYYTFNIVFDIGDVQKWICYMAPGFHKATKHFLNEQINHNCLTAIRLLQKLTEASVKHLLSQVHVNYFKYSST